MTNEERPERASIIVFSDFVCPWCYIGHMELERLKQEYAVDVQWAPFLLDPTVPPEGRPQTPRNQPGDPLTPIEVRGESLGIHYQRGRTYRPNSHLALEAAMYAGELDIDDTALHRGLYRAHFETLENIGDIDTLVRVGSEAGLDGERLRAALETREYESAVDEALGWAQSIGVTAVPTFVVNGRHGIVGAQELPVFERVLDQLGYSRTSSVAG
jgi:predicted DsbA family dithiol-disulfide isomerase